MPLPAYDNTPPTAKAARSTLLAPDNGSPTAKLGAARPVYVKAASTVNVTVPSIGTTLDAVTGFVAGDRCLLKDQTAPAENGIWAYASAGVWGRDPAFNQLGELPSGTRVAPEGGTVNAGKVFNLTTADPITPGTTELTFAALLTAGAARPIGA